MFNPNKITKILGATLVLVGAPSVMAETVSVPTTVTVDNTIDFAFTGTLDFGIIRATENAAAANCAGIVVNPQTGATSSTLAGDAATACPNAGTAVIQSVGGTITRPTFTVAGLSPFTVLNLQLPNTTVANGGAAVDMDLSPKPAGAPSLRLHDFTVWRTSGASPAAVALANGAGTIAASSTGDIAFTIGATITTDSRLTSLDYQNVPYTANFDVTVTY